jgi:hypothetical protein
VLPDDGDHRREGVGGAAGHADDAVPLGIEALEVDAGEQHGVAIGQRRAGRADQDAPGAAIDVRLGAGARHGPARAVDHQIDA